MKEHLAVVILVSLALASCAVFGYTVIEAIKWIVNLNIANVVKLFVIVFCIVFVIAFVMCLFHWWDERSVPDRRGS